MRPNKKAPAAANAGLPNQTNLGMRKITVEIPECLLITAQSLTGEGVTETIRAALRHLAATQAQKEAIALRGKVKFALSIEDLRYDRQ